MRTSAVLALSWVAAACGPLQSNEPSPTPTSTPIVTTERGPRGGRLVFVSEDGRRMAELTQMEIEPVIDSNPAWSPDRKWVVFASSRGRDSLSETSLWVVAGHSRSKPRRLTSEQSVDRDPVWTPDGQSLVFASNVGGTFDLWKVALGTSADGWPEVAGQGTRLTEGSRDELNPTLSPDGTVVFMQLDRKTQRSSLWTVAVQGGTPQRLTSGPADLTPSVSPDGRTIAFAAPVKGRNDTELFFVDADGGNRRLVVEEPYADQTGPRWSVDGRYLFATSVYRSEVNGKPILASLVVLDLSERPPVMRALHDPTAVASRIGAAIASGELDGRGLRGNTPYLEALRRAVAQEVNRAFEEIRQREP